MPDLLSKLSTDEQTKLLEDLNYLNLQELRGFCATHAIPYRVFVQHPDGALTATKDTDRKPIVLARVRHYLAIGAHGSPSTIPARIIRQSPPPAAPGPADRLYYRWYAKEHTGVIATLKALTGGRFADGAVARVLIMEHWTRGEAPTLAEFAQTWLAAKAEERKLLTPEYAYLTDLHHGRAAKDWKALRNAKAQSALATLKALEN